MMTDPARNHARILVVEDDAAVLSVLERVLASAGYSVRTARDAESALAIALDVEPDLVIVDVGLPDSSGVDLTRDLRSRGFQAPVLMLTAYGSVANRVDGLDSGADDYQLKPFEFPELLARVNALLRRASMRAASSLLRVRDVTLDLMERRVERGGRKIKLTQKEYALLEYLMRNAGMPVTRNQIAEHVWKHQMDPATNVVDVYINYLRRKLGDDKRNPLVRTVRGIGYMLSAGTPADVRPETEEERGEDSGDVLRRRPASAVGGSRKAVGGNRKAAAADRPPELSAGR
ncbi:MAG: response regulator transcription factor [Gemmatimonadaceae bacterium]